MALHLDPRLHAYRTDLADVRLRDTVDAARYVQGLIFQVTAPVGDMLGAADETAGVNAQLLYGHDMEVFETKNDWCWGQSKTDGYVGYVRQSALAEVTHAPTHYVLAARTFIYSRPDLKSPHTCALSMGSRVAVQAFEETRGTRYAILPNGEAVIAHHLVALNTRQRDYVSVAESLLHTAYLWGGNSGFGIDCSGLVQLSMACCGQSVLRDSDMQCQTIGEPLELDITLLRRGDLVFWNGHVGIMSDAKNLLHANGHTMTVAKEPLADAVDRISYLYGQPTALRRP